MNTIMLKTNIQKEVWEYRNIFLRLPLVIAVLIIAAPLLNYLLNDIDSGRWMYQLERLAEVQHKEGFSKISLSFITMLFAPFWMGATIVQLYYFIACLFDERRDNSILFWRSLPVSDATSVGVKLLVGALLIPAIFLLAATATLMIFLISFFILCCVMSLGYDLSLWGLWASSDIVVNTLSLWLNLLPYTLWMLPVYAWLMLASMFAGKAPFLWAVLPVVLLLLAEAFVVRYFHLDSFFFAEILRDYFAITNQMVSQYITHDRVFSMVPFGVLVEKISVVALLLSGGMLYGSYWLRANRSHS